MAKGKPAPVVEDVEDEEEVDETGVEELEEGDLDEEEGEVVDEDGEDEEEAPAAKPAKAVKVKKEKKPKAPLNTAQQNFKDGLEGKTVEEKYKYSLGVAKKLGVTWAKKDDKRIDHMLRCMAINKKLAASGTPAPAATAKKAVKK